jgi:hypothetical protein
MSFGEILLSLLGGVLGAAFLEGFRVYRANRTRPRLELLLDEASPVPKAVAGNACAYYRLKLANANGREAAAVASADERKPAGPQARSSLAR